MTPAAADEVEFKHLACVFDKGVTTTYETGAFQTAAPSPLSFDVANIDLDGQAASLIIKDQKPGTLRVIRALNANHFLEVANEGYLNLTTIYDMDPATKTFPAVHSRHFGIIGQPVFGQYSGTCTPKAP
jgi:hypothetical protein